MNLHSIGNTLANHFEKAVCYGGIGYLSTYAFSTTIKPIGGLVFGAAYGAMGLVVDPFFNQEKSEATSRVIGVALKVAGAMALTLAAFGGLGGPFSWTVALQIAAPTLLPIIALNIIQRLTEYDIVDKVAKNIFFGINYVVTSNDKQKVVNQNQDQQQAPQTDNAEGI